MMTLKKALALLLGMVILVTGCASPSTAGDIVETESLAQPMTPTPGGPYKMSIATGVSTSQWYDIGNRLIPLLNEQVPTIQVSMKETKDLMENVDLLTAGRAGLAIVYDYHVVLANQGRLMTAFPSAPVETITIKCGTQITRPMFPDYGEPARIVLPLYEQPLYLIASTASGITSLNDLPGRHVSTGEVGSATEQQARFVLNGLGMDWNADIVRQPLDISAAVDTLKNGQIDALFWSGDMVDPRIAGQFAAPDSHFVLIPITDADAKKIMTTAPGIFHQVTIPGGSFTGSPGDVSTIAVTVVLATMEDFPAAHVQQMLSALFDDGQLPNALKNIIPVSPNAALNLVSEEGREYLHPGLLNYLSSRVQ